MRAAIYTRVSTALQSADSQLAALRSYASQRGVEIVEEFADHAVSGSVSQRPALSRLMDQARKRRFDAVLVFRFDRFARSVSHLTAALSEFRSLNIAFLSYSENIDTSSPIGEAIFTIVGAMAQLERDIIRERVKAGLSAARAKGRVGGRRKSVDDRAVREAYARLASIRKTAAELGVAKSTVQLVLKACRETPK